MAVTYEVLYDADETGLYYVTDTRPGITRRRCGKGFTYLHPDGCDHVQVDGSVAQFEFTGKGGVEHAVSLRDKRLASIVTAKDLLAVLPVPDAATRFSRPEKAVLSVLHN